MRNWCSTGTHAAHARRSTSRMILRLRPSRIDVGRLARMRDSAARKWLFPIATGAVGLAIGLSMTGVRAPQDRASQQSFHGGDTPHTNIASPFSPPYECDAQQHSTPSFAVPRAL